MNNLAEGLYTLDIDGRVTYVNPSAEKMFGWTSAELLGKNMHEVTHYKHPDGAPFPANDCPLLQVLQKRNRASRARRHFYPQGRQFLPGGLQRFADEDWMAKPMGSLLVFATTQSAARRKKPCSKVRRIYRAIGESIDYGIWICDADGTEHLRQSILS